MTTPDIRSILYRVFLRAKISALSPKAPTTIGPGEPFTSAIRVMAENRIGSLLVVERGAAIGIVTDRDLVNAAVTKLRSNQLPTISEIMSNPLQGLKVSASLARAIFTMAEGGFRHLAVEFPSEPLPRIVSVKDVLDYMHRALTKRIAGAEAELFIDDNSVDEFFCSPISVLPIAKPKIIAGERTVRDALEMLLDERIGSVLVSAGRNKLAGIFTERDFVTKGAQILDRLGETQVSAIMVSRPKTVLSTATVSLALELLCSGGFRHLPVVDLEENIAGIISVRTLIDYLSDLIITELSDSQNKAV